MYLNQLLMLSISIFEHFSNQIIEQSFNFQYSNVLKVNNVYYFFQQIVRRYSLLINYNVSVFTFCQEQNPSSSCFSFFKSNLNKKYYTDEIYI